MKLNPKLKSGLFTFLRTILSTGLAVALIYATLRSADANLNDMKQYFSQASHALLLLSILIFSLVLTVTVLRWRVLLKVQEVQPSFLTLCRLTLIGTFFNLAIPGSVSGDLMKMAYVARVAPNRKAEAILTIFLDRVLGLMGLFLVAAAVILLSLQQLLGLGAEHRAIQTAVFLVGLGSIGSVAVLLLIEFRQRLTKVHWVSALIKFAADKLPAAVVSVFSRFVVALELYRSHRMAVVKAILLSVVVHSLLGLELYVIGRALGERSLQPRNYFLAMQVGNAVSSIPITPGGVGTRDAVIAIFLKALEARPEVLATFVPLTHSGILLLWALVGSIVFVFSPRSRLKSSPTGS